MSGKTLAEKVWADHVVHCDAADDDLLYVDLHLVHEATSAQAFDGLRLAGRAVRRPDLTLAVEDHNVPTDRLDILDPVSREQTGVLRRNCARHRVRLFRHGDDRQGIAHVVAPELGHVLPGMTAVCGDSHTSTLGAFGALAFGVGTSDVEHVLATQTIAVRRPATMAVRLVGLPGPDATAKDMALAFLRTVGANDAHGHVVEYQGAAVRALSMEARMTLCNMSIEAGARAGMIAPDDTTYDYLSATPERPAGAAWDAAVAHWRTLRSDPDSVFDRAVDVDVAGLRPLVTWGTNPGQSVGLDGVAPDPETIADPVERAAARRALEYMDIAPGTPMRQIAIDTVFIGSCTNGRLEDLRAAADVLRGRHVADGVRVLVVPGSMTVRRRAEAEGLHHVFTDAGAHWRLSGCSMCLGMNADRLLGAQRCASTSNRNFEGRQGPRARTHLVSPPVAAATAVAGRLAGPADIV